MNNRKPNPSHQVLSKLNSLLLQMQALTKALQSLADSNQRLVQVNSELMMALVSQEQVQAAAPEDQPQTHYMDGTPIRR